MNFSIASSRLYNYELNSGSKEQAAPEKLNSSLWTQAGFVVLKTL